MQMAVMEKLTLEKFWSARLLHRNIHSRVTTGKAKGTQQSGNPGPSGIGVVIQGVAEGPVRIAKWIGHQDNNVAEYAALMEALQYAVALKARKLHVYSDSEVVVRQMTGEYVCRSPRLYSLHWTCRKLARSLAFSISHVRREENAEANQLAQAALRTESRVHHSGSRVRATFPGSIRDRKG